MDEQQKTDICNELNARIVSGLGRISSLFDDTHTPAAQIGAIALAEEALKVVKMQMDQVKVIHSLDV